MSSSARDVLFEHGFDPDSGEADQNFVRICCNEGRDEAVRAFLDCGMSPNTRTDISEETALIKAAEGGHISTLGLLIERGADMELRDSSEDTAFRTALNWSHPEAARFLASKGCDVDAVKPRYAESALEHAVEEDNEEHVDLLLELGADPAFVGRTPKYGSRSPMRVAITGNKGEIVRKLLDNKPSSDDKPETAGKRKPPAPPTMILDEHQVTLLHEAVRTGDDEIVKLLIERGASVDARDAYGLTPLDYALMTGHEESFIEAVTDAGFPPPTPAPQQRARAAMWELIENGDHDEALAAMERDDVHVDARNETHKTPLAAFAEAGHVEGVKRLLSRGANAGAQPTMPLAQALSEGHDEVVGLLLEAKAPLFNSDGLNDGCHGAVWSGHVESVRKFLDACTPADKERFASFEVVKSAVMQKNLEMIELFVEKQVPLDTHDDTGGETPLHGAVSSWHSHEIVRALLDGGAKVDEATPNSETALHKLCGYHSWDSEQEDTMRLLIERGASLEAVDWLGHTPWHAASSHEEQANCMVRLLIDELGSAAASAGGDGDDDGDDSGGDSDDDSDGDDGDDDDGDADMGDDDGDDGADDDEDDGDDDDGDDGDGDDDDDDGGSARRRGGGARKRTSGGRGGPVDVGVLAKKHSWATLPMFIHAGRSELIPQLIDAGVAVDPPQGVKAQPVLYWAVEKQDAELVRELIARGADVNRGEHYGTTPLMVAVDKPSLEIVEMLLDAGADPNRVSEMQSRATTCGDHPEYLPLLKARGARFDERCDSALLSAARGGKKEALDFYLDNGALVDVRGPYGQTPLVSAIEEGHEEIALRLIEAGASPGYVQHKNGETPLTAAAKAGMLNVVKALLAKGADLEQKNKEGESGIALITRRKGLRSAFASELQARGIDVTVPKLPPLDKALTTLTTEWAAAYACNEEKLVEAIESGKLDVNASDPWGTTPLMCAVMRSNTSLVEKLLELGADVKREDANGARAWDYGGFSRDSDVDELLKQKADPDEPPSMDRLNAQAARSLTADAVKDAIERGEIVKLAQMLRDKKVHPFIGGSGGKPLLFAAIDADDDDLIGALLELGFSADVTDWDGNSPLQSALSSSKLELAGKLIESGADVDAPGLLAGLVENYDMDAALWLLTKGASPATQDGDGKTALHHAIDNGDLEEFEKLYKGNPGEAREARDGDGKTPLLYAIENWRGAEDIARFLIEQGADLRAFDKNGFGVLHQAVDNNHRAAAELLLEKGASWSDRDVTNPNAVPAGAFRDDNVGPGWPADGGAGKRAKKRVQRRSVDDDDDDAGDEDSHDASGDESGSHDDDSGSNGDNGSHSYDDDGAGDSSGDDDDGGGHDYYPDNGGGYGGGGYGGGGHSESI